MRWGLTTKYDGKDGEGCWGLAVVVQVHRRAITPKQIYDKLSVFFQESGENEIKTNFGPFDAAGDDDTGCGGRGGRSSMGSVIWRDN